MLVRINSSPAGKGLPGNSKGGEGESSQSLRSIIICRLHSKFERAMNKYETQPRELDLGDGTFSSPGFPGENIGYSHTGYPRTRVRGTRVPGAQISASTRVLFLDNWRVFLGHGYSAGNTRKSTGYAIYRAHRSSQEQNSGIKAAAE